LDNIDVALDPELLGKVFENLLATYNPETGKQARKATGSFYPQQIKHQSGSWLNRYGFRNAV
jgi:hypothetical protein